MSRFAVIDKGELNGYATYLMAIGFVSGISVSLLLNGDITGTVFYGVIAVGGLILLKRTYPDIEWIQHDFLQNQEQYLTAEEFEPHISNKGFRFPGSQKNAEGDTQSN